MQDVVTVGTGKAVNFSGMSVAGKTGTTSKNNDVWFVGYTPYYTAGIWAGYDNNHKLNSKSGETNYHKKIWKAVMSRIHEGLSLSLIHIYSCGEDRAKAPGAVSGDSAGKRDDKG